MTVMGIVIVILTLVGIMIYRNYEKANDLKAYVFGQRLSNSIADSINSLNAVSDGHSTSFELPARLFGEREYTVSFFKNESTVFVDGSSFATSRELTYTSPLTTDKIRCTRAECEGTCNKTVSEDCMNVSERVVIRIAKYAGGIYLTPRYNVEQADIREYIMPYQGPDDISPYDVPNFVRAANDMWDVIYVYHNTEDDTLSLVFSINLTASGRTTFDLSGIIGDVVSTASNEGDPDPEFIITDQPEIQWSGAGEEYDVDGAVIKYSGGFRTCIEPVDTMPDHEWKMLSSDGNHIILDKTEKVCITYP